MNPLTQLLALCPPPAAVQVGDTSSSLVVPESYLELITHYGAGEFELGRDRAACHRSGAGLVADFTRTWRKAHELCRTESVHRVVRTWHGDAMPLADFMLTRVFEVAVHGIDLADALGLEASLRPQAADLLLEILVGPDMSGMTELGWSHARFLRKITGCEPLEPEESSRIVRLNITWLALGR